MDPNDPSAIRYILGMRMGEWDGFGTLRRCAPGTSSPLLSADGGEGSGDWQCGHRKEQEHGSRAVMGAQVKTAAVAGAGARQWEGHVQGSGSGREQLQGHRQGLEGASSSRSRGRVRGNGSVTYWQRRWQQRKPRQRHGQWGVEVVAGRHRRWSSGQRHVQWERVTSYPVGGVHYTHVTPQPRSHPFRRSAGAEKAHGQSLRGFADQFLRCFVAP